MKTLVVFEVGDVVTVDVPMANGAKVLLRDVPVNSTPALDRFTVWHMGRLVEARPEHVVTYQTPRHR